MNVRVNPEYSMFIRCRWWRSIHPINFTCNSERRAKVII